MRELIPHERYIQVLLVRGMPMEDENGDMGVKNLLRMQNFNPISDWDYDRIYDKVMSYDGNKQAITENRKIIESNRVCGRKKGEMLVYDEEHALSTGRAQYFGTMLSYDVPRKVHPSKYLRDRTYGAIRIMMTVRLRSFVEIGLMSEFSISEVVSNWRRMSKQAALVSMYSVSVFKWAFWDVADRSIFKIEHGGQLSLQRYMSSDDENHHYDLHRELLFRPQDEVYAAFGLASEDERDYGKKCILGELTTQIKKNRSGVFDKPIRDDILKLYMYLDTQVSKKDSGKKDASVYTDEIERMKSRMAVVKQERLTMDNLKNYETIDDQETDEPADLGGKYGD